MCSHASSQYWGVQCRMGCSLSGWLLRSLSIPKILFRRIFALDFGALLFDLGLPIFGITISFASKIFWVPSFWSLCGKRPAEVSLAVPFCENSSVATEASRGLLCSPCSQGIWPHLPGSSGWPEKTHPLTWKTIVTGHFLKPNKMGIYPPFFSLFFSSPSHLSSATFPSLFCILYATSSFSNFTINKCSFWMYSHILHNCLYYFLLKLISF